MKTNVNSEDSLQGFGESKIKIVKSNPILNMCFDFKELNFIGSFRFNNLPFNARYLDNLRNYKDLCEANAIKFSGKSKNLNDELYNSVVKFLNDAEGNFFADGRGNYTLCQEWKLIDKAKYLKVSRTLNDDLQEIWDRYFELLRQLKKGKDE